MQEVEIKKSKSYAVPTGAAKLHITHQWGDVLLSDTSVSNSYNYTMKSIGVHIFEWKHTDGTVIKTDHYRGYVSYVIASEFFTDFPELEEGDLPDKFVSVERRVRNIINNYCGQEFGPYVGLTLELEGQGGDTLALPYRLGKITSIADNYDADFTDLLQRSHNSDYFIQRTSGWSNEVKRDISFHSGGFFNKRSSYSIHGNWGWDWVPVEVAEAAKLLIADTLSGSTDVTKHGYKSAQLGDFSYVMGDNASESTGNTEADALLTPYALMNVELI